MKRGRPPKAIRVSPARVLELCASCPLSQCRGTGDALCPVRIETKKYWARKNRGRVEYQRERYLAKKAEMARIQAETGVGSIFTA